MMGRLNAPISTCVVGLDGDDTLWHNEIHFTTAQEAFRRLLAPYAPGVDVDKHLLGVERRNLALYGYGVKSFTLSMIETALELKGGALRAADLEQILTLGRTLLSHPTDLLPGVAETVARLSTTCSLVLITKGDLVHQRSKLAQSGLERHFWHVEVVAEKDEETYERILQRHGIAPDDFLMAGNSLRSDVLPPLTIGAAAVHIPYPVTWAHERVDGDAVPQGRYHELGSIAELVELVERWTNDRPVVRRPRGRGVIVGGP